MKNSLIAIALICSISAFSQVTDAEKNLKTEAKTDTVKSWDKGAFFNLGFSQVTLSNWTAGGNNSVSVNGIANFYSNFTGKKSSWENAFNLGYGLLKQNKLNLQKTDDNIELTSKYGRKATEKWFYAGLLNFKTQFTEGYNYPNDSISISSFMAPGYLLGAAGMNYKHKDVLGLFLSPITSKTTFVLDEKLANAGAFGVDEKKHIRHQIGGYIRANYQKDIMENIKLTTTLGLFSNYLNNPQNIDINWDLMILMKVNKLITVSINTNLIYDDDAKIMRDDDGDGVNEVNGPRTQFKEIITLGLSYKL